MQMFVFCLDSTRNALIQWFGIVCVSTTRIMLALFVINTINRTELEYLFQSALCESRVGDHDLGNASR